MGSRFKEGQAYLFDSIHLGPLVGLEIANVYLNYVDQLRRGLRRPLQQRHGQQQQGPQQQEASVEAQGRERPVAGRPLKRAARATRATRSTAS